MSASENLRVRAASAQGLVYEMSLVCGADSARPAAFPHALKGCRTIVNSKWPRARGRSGFTLLEILIAMLILIVALVSIFALFGAASASHRRAIASQNSAQLAYVVLSELEQVPNPQTLTQITDATHVAFEGYTYDIRFTPVGVNEIQADVTIKWKRGGQVMAESYRTILLAR